MCAVKHLDTVEAYAKWHKNFRKKNPDKTVGLVPTLGALHDGHMALIEASMARCDATVVYIFLNPLQFGPTEDLNTYPQSLESDLARCKAAGVDVVFSPTVADIYPEGQDDIVRVHPPARLNRVACGLSRPHFFAGVCTVLVKMFNLMQPDVAFFGEKDYQQLVIVRNMVEALNMPLAIESVATVRDSDGLALSSRNAYLVDPVHRKQAYLLQEMLGQLQRRAASGETRTARLKDAVAKTWLFQQFAPDFRLDYLVAVDEQTLQPVQMVTPTTRWLIAGWVADIRLIDNGPAYAALGSGNGKPSGAKISRDSAPAEAVSDPMHIASNPVADSSPTPVA
ncbi:MAG: pantoate--beta-alanine ligase [Cyanobacteria bacterium HKST-UBA06]|nr:pantoate--beta-alanine ligase [Cyanobacteria bacterium HKST-UBA06]